MITGWPCTVCGALMADAGLHQRFHDGLREIARLAEAPDMTPEQYNDLLTDLGREAGRQEAKGVQHD